MTRPFVRLILFAVLFLALGAAASRLALLERSLAFETNRADATAREAASALDALLEVRAAERAYVAEGQSVTYWRARAERAVARLAEAFDAMARTLGPTPARATLETTGDTLTRVKRLEDRIAEHALAGRRAHAEDLVFADAIQASTAVERDLTTAAALAREESRTRIAALREQQLIIVGLATAVSLLVALLLVPIGRRPEPAVTHEPVGRAPVGDLPLSLREVSRATPASASSTAAAATAAAALDTAATATAAASAFGRAATARVHAAADLCGALARVQDARDLPALLAHISRVLDAQGTIVWMADADSETLAPALSYGYRDEALSRMGTIAWDVPNPTAEAFRRGEVRVIEAENGAPSALIIPLVSAAGRVGVMTVELAAGAKRDATLVDFARLFAAQLAGVIAPPAAATATATAAAETPRTPGTPDPPDAPDATRASASPAS